ncbi:MAG: hypothetical protein PF487_10895 [Bacteroidales bacterium]|jgi:hypothetical protein|nr:hypothetical protein [Bacteroidales bacterium]
MNDIKIIIISVIVVITVFVAIREFTNWYWKINKRIEIQQLMLETLLKIYEQNGGEVNWEVINKVIDKKEIPPTK